MRRILAAAALSASLLLAGCQNPDVSTNWGNTLLLGAGAGLAAALVAGAASDHRPPRHYAGGYGSRRPPGGYGRYY
jgi:outer membrane murein-binding lipoprotein Lpp